MHFGPYSTKLLLLVALSMLLFTPLPASALTLGERLAMSGFISFWGGGLSDAEPCPGGNAPNDPEDSANPNGQTPKYTAGSGRLIFDNTLSFNQDTRAGLQINFNIDEKTSAVLQYTSRGAVNNFDSVLSWANLSYAIRPDLTIRVGRIFLPIYMVSD